MANRLVSTAGVLIVAAAGVAAYFYWQGQQQDGAAPVFPPSVVAAVEISEQLWEPRLQSVGSLVASNGIEVSTEVSGIISEIVFSSGQTVKQGDVLIRLDDSVDVAALDALRAERKLSKIKFNRARDLLKKNVTSKSEYDEAQALYEVSDARVKQQQAIVQRKTIRAPFAGLVGIREIDPGQYVEAGQAIVELQALDPIYVDFTLAERYLLQIKTGQVVNVKMDAITGEIFSGEVSAINPGIDTGTRTLKVRATLANPDGVLRPGMFADVETITGEPAPVLTVPRTAISFNTYGNFVFVINADAKDALSVKRTPVTTGEERDGRVVIEGLPAGTQLVRTGLIKLQDGMAVKIDNQVELDDAVIDSE